MVLINPLMLYIMDLFDVSENQWKEQVTS